jgi:hypothetical protein
MNQFIKDLNRLKEYAFINRFGFDRLKLISEGSLSPPGDDKNYTALDHKEKIKVVFSYEHHPQGDGSFKWLRHLSISKDGNAVEKYANEEIINLITSSLEFPADRCLSYVENWETGSALNMIAEE